MAVTGLNRLPDDGFFFMRQALVEARLMSEKQACDAVYMATVAEELRNIERKVAALEVVHRRASKDGTSEVSRLAPPEDLPDAEWIHQKARELDRRLRSVEQFSKQEKLAASTASKQGITRLP